MTPSDVIFPAILLLAFIGYVTCLVRWLLPTLVLSTAMGLFLGRAAPFGPETQIYWIAAAIAVLLALGTAAQVSRSGSAEESAPIPMPEGDGVVIDGTNVLFWDGEADLRVLRSVVDHLKEKGRAPYVFLDASSRHHLEDKALDDKAFAKRLGLPRNRVMVCPAGTEADVFILKFAREQGLAIVSNDRFGDRAQQKKGIKLIKGVFAGGKPILHGL